MSFSMFSNHMSHWIAPCSAPRSIVTAANVSLDGGIFRGLKVKNAQDQGMIACIIYTDPAQDGNVTVENGYAEYPDGGARNPSQVQRGSVSLTNIPRFSRLNY